MNNVLGLTIVTKQSRSAVDTFRNLNLKSRYIIKPWNVSFKVFSFLFIACISISAWSQNTSTNIFSANGISEIFINGEQIFEIIVSTEATDKIELKSISDGEYGNEFSVVSEVKGNKLLIFLKRTVLYDTPDDKRNAHKVISAALRISMPKDLDLSIKSDVGSVNATGRFNNLKIDLAQGNCNVEGISKFSEIKTTNGNIDIKTKDAIIETDSKSGLVNFPSDMFGFSVWKLTTTSGNINVTKIE